MTSILSQVPTFLSRAPPLDAHLRALQELGEIEERELTMYDRDCILNLLNVISFGSVQELAGELNGFVTALKSWGQAQGEDLEVSKQPH